MRIVLAIVVAMAVSVVRAQVPTGSLDGRVTDPKDAVLVGAQVTVISIAQGVSRVTVSNGSGLYVVPDLPAGAYDLKIDPKHRLVVPADVRRAIDPDEKGASLIVTLGCNNLPWIYQEQTHKALVSQIPLELTPGKDLQNYIQRNFALATRVAWDDIGRVLLPEKILKKAGVAPVGAQPSALIAITFPVCGL